MGLRRYIGRITDGNRVIEFIREEGPQGLRTRDDRRTGDDCELRRKLDELTLREGNAATSRRTILRADEHSSALCERTRVTTYGVTGCLEGDRRCPIDIAFQIQGGSRG